MTILVVGDANADLSAALEQFPQEGDDIAIAGLGWGSGGSGANVATALALLGVPTRLATRVGRDPAAEVALRAACDAGVDLSAVQHDAALATGLCIAAISPDGARTLFSYRGANAALSMGPGDESLLDDVDWLHIAGHALLDGPQRASVNWLHTATAARDRRIPISLDLCLPLLRARREEVLDLLPAIDILFMNELELAALLPDLPYETVVEQAAGLRASLAAIKLGPRGCLIAGAGRQYSAPAFAVEAIDTTGCGDAFVAGFLHTYLRQATLEMCATLANAMGALTATRSGAAEALPDRKRLRSFLSEHPVATLL